MVVSRTRCPQAAEALAAALRADILPMGSQREDGRVIAGEADIYFHEGGQHEWDNCAPVASG
jgi:3'(2'), 5'-bisphosphate nucleotidase